VKLAGSYTDKRFVAIIMLPVADMNLQTFLENADLDDTSRSFLRPFFGCLTSALSYLHDNRIRHKDVKPSNVLIKHDQVYLTDFGTSLDWTGCDNSTTATAPPTTPRYCAPEVMAFLERNTSSDIWSLGCVFLEMWTVLKRYTLEGLKAHMSANGTQVKEYHHNFEAIASWIRTLENATGPSCDLAPSKWVQNMLQREPRSRWNCHFLADHVQEVSIDPSSEYTFKGLCCLESDEDTPDDTESSDEDYEADTTPPSLPTVDRRGLEQVPRSAGSYRSQLEDLVGTEATSPGDLLSLAHLDAPMPCLLVNDYSVASGAFIKDESKSLPPESYDHLSRTIATDESGKNNLAHDGTMYSTVDGGLSGWTDENLYEEGTDKAPPQVSVSSVLPDPTSISKYLPIGPSSVASLTTASFDRDETWKESLTQCTLCSSLLLMAADAVKLPCHHWIHRGCYAQGQDGLHITCSTCTTANSKPASQANRYYCESNDWARKRNDAQDSLRSSEAAAAKKAVRERLKGLNLPARAATLAFSDPYLVSQEQGATVKARSTYRESRYGNVDPEPKSKASRSKSGGKKKYLDPRHIADAREWARSRYQQLHLGNVDLEPKSKGSRSTSTEGKNGPIVTHSTGVQEQQRQIEEAERRNVECYQFPGN